MLLAEELTARAALSLDNARRYTHERTTALALVTPDGAVSFLDLPAGPPLGLGGLPFENTEIELPAGSILALYTDGLIESRYDDIDLAWSACAAH